MGASRGAALRRVLLLLLGNLLVLGVLTLLVEGGASALLFLRDTRATIDIAERRHTTHDPELGWANVPGARIPDMYGPGIGLTINAQGFRGLKPTLPDVPAGVVRIVCSGDSFTQGWGVSDTESWCAQLGELGPRLETVNMGQGGYGFDQAFLWYRRDGTRLNHQVQVFAFISDDFFRMRSDRFLGYPKPLLAVSGDSLQVTNFPVPTLSAFAAWRIRNADPIASLRVSELFRRLGARMRKGAGGVTSDSAEAAQVQVTERVVKQVLRDLQRSHAARGSRLLLVLLPTRNELRGRGPEEWSRLLAAEADALGISYLDLFPRFRMVPEAEWTSLFLSSDAGYPTGAGHYTREGNALVAAEIHAFLLKTGALTPADSNSEPPAAAGARTTPRTRLR